MRGLFDLCGELGCYVYIICRSVKRFSAKIKVFYHKHP